jgi:hypothetical protein
MKQGHQIPGGWLRTADVLGTISQAAVNHDAEVRGIVGCKRV